MGTAFSEFKRCLPSSRVFTSCASRRTSRCFITPNRVKCGNVSTTSVVVRGPCRRRSRIARRVGSESAFQTASNSSGIPMCAGMWSGAVLRDLVQHVFPSCANALAMFRIDHANRAMTKRDLAASRGLLDFYLQMIRGRIGHEHRPTEFQQLWRLDHLYETPEMPDSISAIAIPASADLGFEFHLQRHSVRPSVAFAKAMKHCSKHLLWRCLDVNVLLNIEHHVFQFHLRILQG